MICAPENICAHNEVGPRTCHGPYPRAGGDVHGQEPRPRVPGPGRPRAPKDDDARIVERLERSLLPSVLEVKGLVTAAEYLPAARHHNVGGDWYDVFEPVPGTVTW